MKSKDLLVLFEGDDISGKLDLMGAYLTLMEEDNSDYCVQEFGLTGHFINYEVTNRNCSMYSMAQLVRFLRKTYDIFIVYVGVEAKNNVYEKFLAEQGATPKKIQEAMQALKLQQLFWLKSFKTITTSNKKYDIMFYSTEDCNSKEDFLKVAKELKDKIEKEMESN